MSGISRTYCSRRFGVYQIYFPMLSQSHKNVKPICTIPGKYVYPGDDSTDDIFIIYVFIYGNQ